MLIPLRLSKNCFDIPLCVSALEESSWLVKSPASWSSLMSRKDDKTVKWTLWAKSGSQAASVELFILLLQPARCICVDRALIQENAARTLVGSEARFHSDEIAQTMVLMPPIMCFHLSLYEALKPSYFNLFFLLMKRAGMVVSVSGSGGCSAGEQSLQMVAGVGPQPLSRRN